MTETLSALAAADPEIASLVRQEERRQAETVKLIPSENYVSRAVLEASGTVLTNKYSEGYPGRRYYEGQQVIDQVEELAIERAKALFGVDHANVQPYSGSPANLAVYLAFAKRGETVMGMALPMGGHLTHGWPVSATGAWFHAVQYPVRREDGRLDLDEVRDLARRERPKLIFCGGTDNHLLLIDLTGKNIGGKPAARALDRAGIETNYNTVPYDPRKPFDPSGIRIGTPCVSSRGMGQDEMLAI